MKIKIGKLVLLPLAVTALTGCDFFGILGGDKKEETGITLKDYSQTAVKDSTYEYDGKVFLQYADSTEEDVTSKATFDYSTLDLSKTGKTSYKVKYEGQQYIWTTTATIEVVTASLELSNYSTFCMLNTTYTFDGKATLKLSNGATEDVTSKAVVDSSKVKTNVEGTYEVKVSYSDSKAGINVSKTFNLKVGEHTSGSLKSIVASGYTTSVWVGETYTFDGVVTANYNESGSTSQEVVTTKCVFGSIDTSSYGNKSLSISYTDSASNTKTTTVTIEVMAHVTGIDASDITVGLNKTKTISATVSPSYAKYKGFTFVSNNTGIATVDSDGKVTGKTIGNTTITISSAEPGSAVTKTINVNVENIVGDEWTVMIYMCGANLESDNSLATSDIEEILGISGQPDDVNIIIETGGSQSWHTPSSYLNGATSIPNSQLGRWHVENNKLVKDSFITNADMSAKETYKSFLQWGLDDYPADNVGVILWNHGAGLEGVCLDDKMNDGYHGLLNSEMQWAHSQVITDKLEFIGFDACLMQNMEIADFNAPYFNYQIASQQLENGEGWYYTGWIDDLYAKRPTTTILSQACSTFIAKEGGDQTLSYLNLSYASTFKTAFENYASALKAKLTSGSVSGSDFADYVTSNVKLFGESDAMGYGQFDIVNWVNKCQTQSKYKVDDSIASAVTNALSTGNYIGQNSKGSSAGQSNGLSLNYRCLSSLAYDADETSFTNWLSFNNTYYGSGGWW